MTLKRWLLFLALWYGLLAVALGVNAYAAPSYQDARLPALSRVASQLAGRHVVVVRHNFGPGSPAGEARLFEDGSAWIGLAPAQARTLSYRPRIVAPEYPRPTTAEALLTLAHEIGHVQGTPDPGQWEESRADCYAARHWRTVALRVGFTRSQLPALARQMDVGPPVGSLADCWGPYR